MEGMRGPSYKTQLCDMLENYLGAEAVEPIRGDTSIRNGKKRRISAGPRPQPMVADPKLQNASKALQDNPDPVAEKCSETEAAFASLLIRGCGHGPQTDFLYTLLPPLHKSALLDWTPLLEYLLAAYPSTTPKNGKAQDDSKPAGAASKPGTPAASPKSPKGSEESLERGPPERLTGGFMAQMRAGSPKEAASPKEMPELSAPALPAFRPVLCRAAHAALDSAAPVKPLTCLALLRLALTWINSATEFPGEGKGLEAEKEPVERERNEGGVDEVVAESMRLVRRLTLDDTHLLPTYVLLDETLILGDSIPSDEPLLSFLYDIHKRRDKVVYYFTRTDCQIRSPTFATLRAPPFTLQGILGEPIKGAELAAAVPPHSREWERAMACLKQGLRNSVSADWWRRVLVLSPQFQQGQVNPSAEFSAPMLTEALVLRTLELLRPYPDSPGEIADCASWQEWCLFADLLFQIVRSGHVDFLSYLEQLSQQGGPKGPPRSPLLAWLFSQLVRLEAIIDIFKRGTQAEKQRTFELLVHFAETPPSELSQAPHVAVLLDWAPSFLVSRLSMSHKHMNIDVPFPALAPAWQADLTKRIKEGESWWQAFEAGKVPQDSGALDDVTTGRLWFLSHSRSQEFTKVWFGMLRSQGTFELPGTAPGEAPLPVIREVKPMPVGFLTGIAIQSLSRLTNMIEELVAMGQPAVSVSMLETYVRVLLVSPQSLYRKLFESLLNKYKPGDPRMTGTMLTLLELLNYRLLPFYRYHNKLRALWGDLERILAALLTLPGQHRLYRLTENVSMSVIGNIHRDFTDIKRATKGLPTSETVNRLMVLNIAVVSKTRGLASPPDVEHIHTAVKHLLAHSTHAWSEKTLRHFPASLREMLKTREDVRGRAVLAEWQKHGKAIITTHSQLAKPAADPAAVSAYLKNAPREFRRWAATALWTNMEGRHDKPNLTNFARALRDFTPEEITGNVYVLVDFILHSCTKGVTKGEPEATVLARTAANLAHILWVEELLPYDVTLLALADRDDHPQALSLLTLLLERPEISQRVQRYCAQRGPAEHWTREEVPVRADLRAALGAHYAGSDRHPPLFDDLCLRALPVLPVLVGRLVEHDRFDAATKLLTSYGPLLTYHPSKLMVVRDLLAYYHGIMPPKLVNTLVTLLDVQKYGFSEPFSNYLKHPENAEPLLAPNYFLNLLTKVAHVLPSMGETLYSRQSLNPAKSGPHMRRGGSTGGSSTPWRLTSVFAKHQDCATQAQVLMATVEVELLAIPFPAERTARALVGAALWPENVGRMERNNRTAMAPRNAPGGSSQSPLYRPGITPSAAQFAETTGIVLAQLPVRFHVAFFEEVQSVISAAPWFNGTLSSLAEPGGGGTLGRLEEPGVRHRLQGWPFAAEANNAAEEGTVTGTTQVLGMAHAFGYAVPFEWLGSLSSLVIRQRPIRSGAHLRLCFKMVGPMVPAMAPSRPLFAKTLALLFTILADVFGRSSTTTAADAAEMSDLVDFLHHCVTLEGRYMSPGDRSAHMSTLRMCTQAIDRLHPELQKLFRHLVQDPESALFAAEIAQKNQQER